MTLCKFYLNGYCRFGENCRFEHSDYSYSQGNRNYRDGGNRNDYRRNDNYHWQKGGGGVGGGNNSEVERIAQAIREEIILIENGNMWPLTCFSPIPTNGNFRGWEDYSPEEIRHEMWKAYQTNTVDSYEKAVRTLQDSFQEKRRKLKTINRETLEEVREYLTSSPESGNGILSSSIFQSSTSVFGSSAPSQNFSFASAFGNTASQTPSAASSFSFGQAFSNASAGSIFGGQSSNTGSIFGAQLAQSGVLSQNQAPQQTSVFGGQSQPQQQSSIFAQNPSQTSLFAQNQPAQQVSVFQNSNSVFGSSNTTVPTNSIFGNALSQVDGFVQNNAFEQQATGGVFGNSSLQNPFPSNSQQIQFSGNTTNSNNTLITNVNAFPGACGSAASSTSVFSPVDSLSKDELLAFEAQTFSFKKIPLSAPPENLCY